MASTHVMARMDEMFSVIQRAIPDAKMGLQFAATPSVERTLIKKLVETGGWFFTQGFANFLQVRLQGGQRISMSVSPNIARTHATSTSTPRIPAENLTLEDKNYLCREILHDLIMPYATLDTWAEFSPNFMQLYSQLRMEAMLSSFVKIGWYGTSRASGSNISTSPDMEDVAVGWLKQIVDWNTANPSYNLYLNGITVGTNTTTDFKSVDKLVHSIYHSIPNYIRNSYNYVVLVSSDVMAYGGGHYYDTAADKATEKVSLIMNSGAVLETFGGLKAYVPPFFPAGTIMVLPLNQLYIYMQSQSIRRTVWDRPDFSGIADYNSGNYCYVVQDERTVALVDGITFDDL